jgi:hypothetical protein
MLAHTIIPWYMRSHPILVKSSTSQNCASFPLLLILSTCGLLLNSQPESKRPESKYSNVEIQNALLELIFFSQNFPIDFLWGQEPNCSQESLSLSLSPKTVYKECKICIEIRTLGVAARQRVHEGGSEGGREGGRRKKASKSWTNEDDERCAW